MSAAAPSATSPAAPSSATQVGDAPIAPVWGVVLACVTLVTLAVIFAEPVRDGDLWWHLVYARYMLENRTLIPDHTIFTWTPTETGSIYCSWLADLLLYLGHVCGRLPLLFVLRYLCMLSLPAVGLVLARRYRVSRHPLVHLSILCAVLMSYSAAYIKPEILSYVLMTLTTAVWIRLKASDEGAWTWCYAFPVLMLVWVNAHGGFIFGLAFLACMLAGEELNALYCPAAALPLRVRQHLFATVAASAMVCLVTPYGLHYPRQLLRDVFGGNPIGSSQSLGAYVSIFYPGTERLHYPQYLVVAVVILLVLCSRWVRSRRFDWSIAVTNIAFALLYTRFLRTTFYWAPIFAYSVIVLLAQDRRWLWPSRRRAATPLFAGIAVVALALSSRAVYESVADPASSERWLGFGVSYFNPVEETEFIRDNCAGARIGNDYDSGAYLMWRLWPHAKVFIDPRQFPFRSWYAAYRQFETGRDIPGLLRRFPSDIWLVKHRRKTLMGWFQRSPEWHPVFYGPVGAVFRRVASTDPRPPPARGEGLSSIRNVEHTFFPLIFALNVGDVEGAQIIYSGMKKRYSLPVHREAVDSAARLIEAVHAYQREDYAQACKPLAGLLKGDLIKAKPLLVNCLLQLAAARWRHDDYGAAVRASEEALKLLPDSALASYNAGVARWHAHRVSALQASASAQTGLGGNAAADTRWRALLRQFVDTAERDEGIPRQSLAIARQILEHNTYQGRPPLLQPPKLFSPVAAPSSGQAP